MQRQFRELGVQVPLSEDDEALLAIMPNAWESFCAFLECQTQWRAVAGMGGLVWLGLDYSACREILAPRRSSRSRRRPSPRIPSRIFDDLRLMEAAALPVLNEVA